LWGAIHGIALIIHKFFRTLFPKDKSSRLKNILALLLTFHIVVLAWIPFRADNMEIAGTMISRLFTSFHSELLFQVFNGYGLVLGLIGLGYLLHFVPEKWELRIKERVVSLPFVVQVLMLTLMILIIFQFKSATVQPFIYFQF